MNHNYTLTKNPRSARATAHAINKQALIDTFYAGQGVVADNWMPPGTQYYKPLNLPTYDPEKAKALIAESGETDLTLDFWYPSDVTRPYMPDPKGLFSDRQRPGGRRVHHQAEHRHLEPGLPDAEFAGEYPAWLIGWTCDWAGPDNFLRTAFFNYVDGKAVHRVLACTRTTSSTRPCRMPSRRPTRPRRSSCGRRRRTSSGADIPTVPLVSSTPPGATRADVMGFVGSGGLNEYLNTVWLDR